MSRRTWWVVGAVAVGGAVAAALALPPILRERLTAWAHRVVAEAVDADVGFGTVQVSLFSTFPRVEVALSDVVVTNRAPWVGVELARIPRLELGVDLFSALSGNTVRIERVAVRDALVRVVYDEAGRANYDIAAPSDPSAPASPYHLQLDRVDLENLGVVVENTGNGLKTTIEDIDLLANADLTQSVAKVDAEGTIASLTAEYGGVTWLHATQWRSTMHVDYDQDSGAITFGDNQVTVNALPLTFHGTAAPQGDGWLLDLGFAAKDTSFASLLSLVPAAFDQKMRGVDAAGEVSLEGTTKGLYDPAGDDLPPFDLALRVRDARFKFDGLPTGVDRVEADLVVAHPGGAVDAVVVDARRFALGVAGAVLEGRARVAHPVTDPDLDVDVAGRLDLGALGKALPEGATTAPMAGQVDMDLAVKGRVSAFQAGRADQVAAEGTFVAHDLSVHAGELPVQVRALDLALSPRLARVNQLALAFDGSDVAMSGTIEDLVPWALADDPLRGTMTLKSNRLDLRPFQAEEEPNAKATEDDTVLVAVPTDVDLSFDADIRELQTDGFTMADVTGKITVKGGAVRMQRMNASMLGGEVTLNGSYIAPTTEQADLDLEIVAARLDLAETARTFSTLKRIAPLLEGATGRFDSGFSLRTALGRDGTPDLARASSAGAISPQGVAITTPTLTEVATQLRSDQFKQLELSNTRIAYAFEAGRVRLPPFEAKLGPQPATISGQVGPIDRALDLQIDLPVSTAALKGSPLVASLGAALPATADVRVKIEGTLEQPKVRVLLAGAADIVSDVVSAAVDDLVAKAVAEGDALLAAAQAQADKLIDEAKKTADKLVADAAAQAKKVRKEAKGNPLKEAGADAAAKLIEQEGDKAAKKVTNQAKKAADALVAEAKARRDALIADARAKMGQ